MNKKRVLEILGCREYMRGSEVTFYHRIIAWIVGCKYESTITPGRKIVDWEKYKNPRLRENIESTFKKYERKNSNQ